MSKPFLQIKDLHHTFHEGGISRTLLEGVNLDIESGKTVAILGRSGCGKSTLLNLISGIDQCSKGSILIDGNSISDLDDRRRTLHRRQHIGFVYQFFHLVPTLTVYENIALMLELNGWSKTKIEQRVNWLLERTGLSELVESFPDRLSGGEQQRVALVRAVAHKPALILADEPTGNLDAKTGARVLALLKNLVTDEGSSLILVTHSLAVARQADRILTLENGKLVARDGDFAW